MGFQLRPKQIEAAQHAVDFLTDGRKRNGVLIEPTAFGKSLLITEIANQLGGGLVVFQPSVEILEQNLAKLESYGHTPGIWSASKGRKDLGDIVLATIGSAKNHPEVFDEFPYVLVDEGHAINPKQGMYKNFFEALGDVKILALTATPWRLHSNSMGSMAKFITRTRPKIIDEVVHYTQIAEMVKDGYWAKLEYWPVRGFKRSKLVLNSAGAEYDEKAVQLHLWEKNWQTKQKVAVNFPDKLTEVVNRLLDAGRKHILVFTSFVRESEYLAEQMKGECAVVTGDTHPDARRDILESFKAGDIRVVTNCAVLIHGFDFPALDCVVDASVTASLSRHYQKLGRGVRTDPPNKESCWIVDMVEGYETFGKIEDLMLYCEGQSKWGMYGRPGGGKEVPLTNVLIGGAGPGCCPKCLAPKSVAYYAAKGKWLPVSLPIGRRGDLVIEHEGTKKICRHVGRGQGTHVFHFTVCDRIRAAREAGQ